MSAAATPVPACRCGEPAVVVERQAGQRPVHLCADCMPVLPPRGWVRTTLPEALCS